MEIELVEIDELTFDPNNARQHDSANLKAIETSLREFGQRKPIVATSEGVIVAGNGTVEAAKRLGWKEILIVRVPEDWTSEQVMAFALADNRTAELATWKPEVLSEQLAELETLGFEVKELGFKSQVVELPDNLLDDQEEARLDQRATITCPSCACEFRKTATGFEVV